MKRFLDVLLRPALVPVWVLVIAFAILVPGLGGPGLWEPQELAVADAVLAKADRDAKPAPTPPAAVADADLCRKQAPDDRGARTLTDRLAATAAVEIDGTDGGLRLPFALLAVLCVVATAGIALRLGGPRAGLIAGGVCLSFPILVLEARQLTSDIGTPTAAALLIYAAVAFGRPARGAGRLALDLAIASAAAALGAYLGWLAGGALLGLLVPIGAIALAGGLGLRPLTGPRATDEPLVTAADVVAIAASLAAVGLIAWLAKDIYSLKPPTPGTRELLGKSIIPSDCWSTALGGLWKVDDDVGKTFDSVFEQIGYGTFPWGILALVALFGLATADDRRLRTAGHLTLAWSAIAWLATQLWHRKVGYAAWAGFPAMAVAIGVWLDGIFAARARADQDEAGDPGELVPALAGVLLLAAATTLAIDVAAFPDRLVSLLVGGDPIKFPAGTRWLGIPLKAWVFVIGIGTALAVVLGTWCWRPATADRRSRAMRALGRYGLAGATASSLAVALFWVYGWHAPLSARLSSKQVFTQYRELRADGDTLGIMGDMGNAPRYYADGPYDKLATREALMSYLAKPTRVFALAPAAELCAIHRAAAGKRYFVLDDTNPRTLLLSNREDGGADHNPLATTVLRTEPPGIGARPKSPIVYDEKIELVGWTIPKQAAFGSTIEVTLYFKVREAVGGSWKIFEHFDGMGQRFQGDHDPIAGRCATSYWQKGDYIVDTTTVETGGLGMAAGSYDIRIGFFTGSNPNWKNMTVSQAPAGKKDSNNRVLIDTIQLE
ncbi:MAG: hypothetical protein K8W52_17740 [Deltaproteobacteria bacterium]|nr:hypothetical protein [Deltaproteobacteria bacterium]